MMLLMFCRRPFDPKLILELEECAVAFCCYGYLKAYCLFRIILRL